jgi:DMSO/TMAO reductase YedYZ molybdopterin-dependent catalytic subunit
MRSRQGRHAALLIVLKPVDDFGSIAIAVSIRGTNRSDITVQPLSVLWLKFLNPQHVKLYIRTTVDISKDRDKPIPSPQGLPDDVIISPDTRRGERIPPGQSRTRKWPVLDASGPPVVDIKSWRFRVSGLVGKEVEWNWEEFVKLPRVKVFADFHCVTRWSRLGNLWEGVATRTLLEWCGGAKPEARYATVRGYDRGWTTNLPLEYFLAEDALVAFLHDGESLSPEHGGPARLIVPSLYAWKSAKWVAGVELTEQDHAGFWEVNGYHMRGDPWQEERYGF